MTTTTLTTADGVELKTSLRRALRRDKLRALLLVAPLFLFVPRELHRPHRRYALAQRPERHRLRSTEPDRAATTRLAIRERRAAE